MLKSFYLIWGIGVFLVFWFFWYFFSGNQNIIFAYPNGEEVFFAGEGVNIWEGNYYNKERFDKEFLISGNNLYQFYLYIKRYPLYIPYIEEKLEKAGIPEDFKYLPIAESALREDVISWAGAAGIWQFMPETAKRYGLRIDEQIDERYNFERATDSALTYIQDLYDIFGNWTLAAAAYNRGENGLKKDMQSQKVDNYYDLYLNDETSRYVFRILAIKYLIESYETSKNVFDKIIGGVYKKPNIDIVEISGPQKLLDWSLQNGYMYRDVRMLNRWILWDTLPEGKWKIRVPQKN